MILNINKCKHVNINKCNTLVVFSKMDSGACINFKKKTFSKAYGFTKVVLPEFYIDLRRQSNEVYIC